jgi:cytochrome c biogenesis protein CcmG/thiol:disulfide interchange protein DsbE
MRRILPLIPIVVVLALATLFATYGLHHDPQVLPAARVGKPLPSSALPPIKGGPPQTVAQAAGGPALVNVFASWCGPCAVEAPQLMALKARGVPIVGLAYEDQPGNTLAFLDRLGNPFSAILVDRSGDTGVDLGISGVPETFLVDRNGLIVAKHAGALSDRDAADMVSKLHALKP